MKKEFSFYEFTSIIVPSVILLFSLNAIFEHVEKKVIVDFGKIGETVIFMIIAYGVGHIIQSLGNIYEKAIWTFYIGMPTKWLTNKNRFGKNLFEEKLNQTIIIKVKEKYAEECNDYGQLVYNKLYLDGKTNRIDIFLGNYGLYRGLSITFFILFLLSFYYYNWQITIVMFLVFILITRRMIRFAIYYAKEVYKTFYNS